MTTTILVMCKSKNPLPTNVEGVHDDAYITKMHMENLWKQRFMWKPQYCTSFTWAFCKVNNNQSMDLEHNLIMKCIICHNDYVDIKILTMHTKFRKGLIACHKTNGITTMNKCVEVDHFAFVKKLTKDPNCIPLAKLQVIKRLVKNGCMFLHL
jgi:hypothetical protein